VRLETIVDRTPRSATGALCREMLNYPPHPSQVDSSVHIAFLAASVVIT
jgi:hypothetical protein